MWCFEPREGADRESHHDNDFSGQDCQLVTPSSKLGNIYRGFQPWMRCSFRRMARCRVAFHSVSRILDEMQLTRASPEKLGSRPLLAGARS